MDFLPGEIESLPLGVPHFRKEVEAFLAAAGLSYACPEVYYVLRAPSGAILCGAGRKGDIIVDVAVDEEVRGEGLLAPLLSHLVAESGRINLKVFTKAEYRSTFESLGFKLLASAPAAVLLESGRGLALELERLRAVAGTGRVGFVLMHANPFTLGHRYLLEQALKQVDRLFVLPVKDGDGMFSYEARLEMLRAGVPAGVTVLDGSGYQISTLTFPSYFIKEQSVRAETQMRLDIDLFARHIAPALGVSVRFVGSEPLDPLTARYNELMKELLPQYGLQLVEISRLSLDGAPVSASRVRALLSKDYSAAAALVPASTQPFLRAHLAAEALRAELNLPGKPGLVGPDGPGAHSDMNYALMQRAISALEPWFARMAAATSPQQLQALGLEAEKAMLEATGGVNTHKGAIFALGLALYASRPALRRGTEVLDNEKDMQNDLAKIAGVILCNSLNDKDLRTTNGQDAAAKYGAKGAREMALSGYAQLFQDWLPFYRRSLMGFPVGPGMTNASLATLLRIMSQLDDTCILHRGGPEKAQKVKDLAAKAIAATAAQTNPGAVIDNAALTDLQTYCQHERLSPGGAADMLALTIYLNTLTIW